LETDRGFFFIATVRYSKILGIAEPFCASRTAIKITNCMREKKDESVALTEIKYVK
jgi:hypothetical protein